MTSHDPTTAFDGRFSDPEAAAVPWSVAQQALTAAELYWITTVRADGRPHITPLIGLWLEDTFCFCTGFQEQKAVNLEQHLQVAVTTGTNTWAEGLDLIIEGTAERVVGRDALTGVADAYVAKYGEVWRLEPGEEVFNSDDDNPAALFRVRPSKVLAFAKSPHGQTSYRFS